MNYNINFEVTRNEDGRINGVRLNAKPQREAIAFCSSFPKALLKDGTANITFEGNNIVFKHPKCDFPGKFIAEINPTDIEELMSVINPRKTIDFEQWSTQSGGFRLYVKKL